MEFAGEVSFVKCFAKRGIWKVLRNTELDGISALEVVQVLDQNWKVPKKRSIQLVCKQNTSPVCVDQLLTEFSRRKSVLENL